MSRDLILCIDDSVVRYRAMTAHVSPERIVMISDEPAYVQLALEAYGERIYGVCLDHDMRVIDGVEMAKRFLIARNLPVAVTSANPVGVKNIQTLLTEYAVPNVFASASSAAAQQIDGVWWVAALRFFAETQASA